MLVQRSNYLVKGAWRLNDYALRWSYMLTTKGQYRLKVLSFWQKHGLQATLDAYPAKRRTLYDWKQKLRQGGGVLESVNEKSTRPRKVRTRDWSAVIVSEIRRLRTDHPNLGKEKVHVLLKPFCLKQHLKCPKPKTIGRMIASDPKKMRTYPVKVTHFGKLKAKVRVKRLRKPKDFKATHPGHCGSLDTIEKILLGGLRRYVITFVDIYSRFTLAFATTSHGSQAAQEFFTVVTELFPYQLQYVLTDNGSEFMKHFDLELKKLSYTHWHTYPKTPKMNAHCERFNRTIQEEFIDYHLADLKDPSVFNAKLADYLLWYNGERPHWSLNLLSPVQFLLTNHPKECNMWWPNTFV